MEIIIIAGLSPSGIIGKNNQLPWHIPEDLQNFRNLTKGKTVLMGRATFASISKPLPNRKNIVISKTMTSVENMEICASLEEGLAKAKTFGADIFIIGGASIYAQALPFAQKMILSHIKKEYEGDTYFPSFNKEDWEVESEKDFPDFILTTYLKKTKTLGEN